MMRLSSERTNLKILIRELDRIISKIENENKDKNDDIKELDLLFERIHKSQIQINKLFSVLFSVLY